MDPEMVAFAGSVPKGETFALLKLPPAPPAASRDRPAWFGVNKAVYRACGSPARLVGPHAAHQGISGCVGSRGLFLLIDPVWVLKTDPRTFRLG